MRLTSRPFGRHLAGRLGLWIFAAVIGFLSRFGGWTPNLSAQDLTGRELQRLAESELVDVIARCEGAVVALALTRESTTAGPLIDPFRLAPGNAPDAPDDVPGEFGTGVIIGGLEDPDLRYLLTNYHVVHGSRRTGEAATAVRILVRLSSRHAVWASEIAGDPRSDLSVLSLDLQAEGIAAADVPYFELREAPQAKKGQTVIALGNPYAIARDGSASAGIGIISNIARRSTAAASGVLRRQAATIHEFGTLLTIDARLQFGSSGGALVDLDGNLIGITTALAALEGYEASAGYAIPLDAGFRRVIDSLLAGYEVEYGYLGVALRDVLPEETRAWPTVRQPSAAGADHVAIDSPAQLGGLHPGDVILAVNGVTIYGADDVTREVGLLGPESLATLTVYRPTESQAVNVEVRLGKWPVPDDSGIIATSHRWPAWRGLGVDYSTARSRFMPFDVLLEYRKAVLVHEVIAGSPAAQAGLVVGDMISAVNGTPVETPAEFHRLVSETDDAVELELLDGRRVVLPDDRAANN